MTLDHTRFFVAPNLIRPTGQDADSILARLSSGAQQGLMVLPWREEGGRPRWYIVCTFDRTEQLREELTAHAGISFTDFRGQGTQLDPRDNGDRKAAELTDGLAVTRIELLHAPGHRAVSAALMRLTRLWNERPATTVRAQRAVAELLSSLKLALLSGDRAEAEQLLEQLREGGDLEVINLLFMEIDLVSRFDGPAAVLSHPQLKALVQIRRPARVTDILARAVDLSLLRPDGVATAEVLVQRFRALDERLKNLLVSAGECRSSSGLLLVGLRALELGSRADLSGDRSFGFDVDEATASVLEQLDGTVPQAGSTAPPLQVDNHPSLAELLESGGYEEVLELATNLVPDFEVVDAVLRAAQWLDSIAAAQRAIEILESAPEDVRARFAGNRLISPLIEALRSSVRNDRRPQKVGDWNALLEGVRSQPDWSEAVEAAEHGALEWPVSVVVSDASFGLQLAANVTQASESARPLFSRVVPHLIEWIDRVPVEDRPRLLDAFEALIAYFAFNDRTRVGLDLLGGFASDVLSVGLTPDRYRFCLESLEIRWEDSASPSTVVWASDVLEALIDQPCPDRDRRLLLATKLLRAIASFSDRVDPSMLGFLVTLAEHLGLAALLPPRPASVALPGEPQPPTLLVGIYSLTPGALVRARDALRERWAHVTVECRSDHVASEQLRQLARRADLMVVATRSATHEATICINTNRPTGLPTLLPSGKGSASILRSVDDWVRNRA